MTPERPWRLVAPWYYWQRQLVGGMATSPRTTRPAFQKFDNPGFVNGFLKSPQRSLVFKSDVDQVFTVSLAPAPLLTSGPFAGKSISLYAPKAAPGSTVQPQKVTLVPSGVRKLFLDIHRRYYLVVCELHCDAPGFPTTTPDQVCQAGFVVRRRYLLYPASAEKDARALLQSIVATEAKLAYLDELTPARPREAQKRTEAVLRLKAEGTFAAKRQALSDELARKRQQLDHWRTENGVSAIHEGWRPGPFDKVGDWAIVEETPQALTEDWFPLFPLYPNPDIPDHDAKGRNLYFGVVPTSSHDTDAAGKARFDDHSTYEIRCFVRRHKPECPRTDQVPDCHGELVWSEPTEIYRLAAHTDLVGTSNRPVTIQMPDLAELAGQAANLPFGKFSPVKVVQKQSLKPQLSGMSLSGGAVAGVQICFFAIPLITIVAVFLFQLFLPIVMLVFGLWFLLAFKFCIPPSFSLDMGLQAALSAIPPSVNVDASFSVTVGSTTLTQADIHAKLSAEIAGGVASTEGIDASAVDLSVFANSPLIALNKTYSDESRLPSDVQDDPPVGLDLTANLEFEPRVTAQVGVS